MRLPALLSRLKPDVHKYDFGHVLVVAGSPSMLGAACLVSLAAMRSGAGLTTAAVPRSLNVVLQKKITPVVMTLPVPQSTTGGFCAASFRAIENFWQKASVVVLGPGLGREKSTQQFARRIIRSCPRPLIIDADALFALVDHLDLLQTDQVRILTPHEGEFFRLSGSRPKEDEQRRSAAKAFAKEHGCVLVLKGHRSCVASPQGDLYINTTGNPGMATAGSGDVLCGVIAAFIAQGIDVFEAVTGAVWAHGRAGDVAAKEKGMAGMIAADIIDKLPVVIKRSSR